MASREDAKISKTAMKKIISAGVIVFRRTKDGPKFLLLYHGGNYWNFPKGKIEGAERSWEAAVREVHEETGIYVKDLHFKSGFRTSERFVMHGEGERAFKIVIFYLAETHNPHVMVSHEHDGYGWFTAREAMRVMKYKDSQRVLRQAMDFLDGKQGQPRPSLRNQSPVQTLSAH